MKQIDVLVKGGCVLKVSGVPKGYQIIVFDEDEGTWYPVMEDKK